MLELKGAILKHKKFPHKVVSISLILFSCDGVFCEGDFSGLFYEVIAFGERQIKQLSEAGYPP